MDRREIKFRAWDKQDKKMTLFDGMIKWDVIPDEYEVMQFTGLKDKNGKEIYEGDIVKGNAEYSFNKCIGVVKYGAMAFHFSGKKEDGSKWFDTITNPTYEIADFVRVIGNVYENPELLESEESNE
jgi:uncharacterized phage protein (TIGR01671 family)